ncbi:hypothetical protein WJ95_20280 [Burkholderia ubonensis]|uniref:hypothetical protein n=1 Tax=Burkholderia ubonensis TaxID=101571 RepID=UPI00075919F4|nr:hypothetical protein [Burkholderia ubonensis]KVO65029.1 hypothetical protein WJ78_18100 [Burkholderia ubonensis]KVP77490.1 hypothetical protein WJ92_02605 [Burkholderia ubonensis]KVP84504.1 hypothetical protein WJ95_20280 [Burkholderia ubonensis]KVP90023.1 hypothetical protein WJ97_23880 [Burkholderia ubonensis]
MLLDKIGGADAAFRTQIENTYWGGKVGCEPHPKFAYGCDVLPNGWTEITWEEFAKSKFFWYTPIATGWLRTTIGNARLFFMHDRVSFAMIGDHSGGTVKVFQFGCKHVMESKNVSNCLHRYTCTKCGFSEVVDSSD